MMKRYSFFIAVVSTLYILILYSGCQSSSSRYADGEKLYTIHCANCHMDDGSGLAALYPPLYQSDYLQPLGASLACIIRKGIQEPITVNGVVYEQAMPANAHLSDVEITNICNYVLTRWTEQANYVSLEDVKRVLKDCE